MASRCRRNDVARARATVVRAVLLAASLVAMLVAIPHAAGAQAAPTASSAEPASAARRAAALDRLVALVSAAPVPVRLEAVNAFFNALYHAPDRELWGRPDYWATPEELLRRGAGDCEDVAIAKYFTLRRLGIPARSLRLVYLLDRRRRAGHVALLHVPPGAPPLLLDRGARPPRPLAERPELQPVYALDEHRVTVFAQGEEHAFAHAGRWRVRAWDAMLRRMGAAAHRERPPDAPVTGRAD